jgi:phage terminase large subunit-like protein
MSREQLELLARIAEQKKTIIKYNKIAYMYPDKDIYDYPFNKNGYIPARHKYPKQLEFFKAGSKYAIRKMLAPNRSGKSLSGGAELAYHATGNYPSWWEGKRFNKPLKIWVGGVDAKSLREGAQNIVLGSEADLGTGLIPKKDIIRTHTKPGVDGAIDTLWVRYKGDDSRITVISFKSYEEKISSWAAADIDIIWLDEEPDLKLYAECVPRIINTNGILYSTMTPDKGLSETILQWFPEGYITSGAISDDSYCVTFDMDDVPHLTDEEKKRMYDELPPYAREAKYFGRPNAGVGMIYPIHRADIEFKVNIATPDEFWPRGYGMDPGWIKTAVVWGAYDEKNDVIYIYDEYIMGKENGTLHASAIMARGSWMIGVIDKAAKGNNSNVSSENALDFYTQLGLNLVLSDPGHREMEAGIVEVWNRLSTGKLKIASHLQHIFRELNLYRKNDIGEIVTSRGKDGTGHDLLDALRYLVRNIERVMSVKPDFEEKQEIYSNQSRNTIIGGY